jgi:predicted RNase H-like HicB family nuclease
MSNRYTVSDGKLMLTLEEAPEGGYVVSSPLDPGLWTQAETIAEAFANARDAMKALAAARRKPLTVPAAPRSRRRSGSAA